MMLVSALTRLRCELALRAWINARSGSVLRILSLHRVIDPQGPLTASDHADLARGCLSLPTFEAGLEYLLKHYRILPLSDCVRLIREGRDMPANAVVLTFDDGFRDVVHNAFPRMQAKGVPFTVFLTTGWVDARDGIMCREEVRDLAERGGDQITWGAHGVTHRRLTGLTPEDAEQEIVDSRAAIQAMTGRTVSTFCYPDGKHDEITLRILKRHGFDAACATGRRLNYAPFDVLALQRIPFEEEPLPRFAFRVAGRV